MDTSKSDSEKIIDYIMTGKVKDLPPDLSVLDPNVAEAFIDKQVRQFMADYRGATMRTIGDSLQSWQQEGQKYEQDRAIFVFSQHAEAWTDDEFYTMWFLNRDSQWVETKYVSFSGRFVSGRWKSTREFMVGAQMPGKPLGHVRTVFTVLSALSRFAADYEKAAKARFEHAHKLSGALVGLRERSGNLL